jgi:hypothetical protein
LQETTIEGGLRNNGAEKINLKENYRQRLEGGDK